MSAPTVLHVLAPAPFGGLDNVVHALAAGRVRRGLPVHVAAVVGEWEADHPFCASLRAEGVPVHEIAIRLPGRRRERDAIRALLLRTGARVLHAHGYRPEVLDAPVARRLGVRVVSTAHGFTGGPPRVRAWEALHRRAMCRTDAVVAVSDAERDERRRDGVPADRMRVIRNAHVPRAPAMGRAEARAALGIPADAFHVGWAGRLSREKGLDVLIDALPALRGLPVLLSVLGDGGERPALEARAAALGVAPRVRWHGYVADAGRWFAAFDAFVVSSRMEAASLALLEAMAARVPVAAAAVGGVPGVVGPAEALLVPPESPRSLADAIRAIHADPASAAERARRAADRLAREFGAEAWLDAYEDVYRAVLA